MSNIGDNSNKKRKRTSPFRIKVGCLVALRFRPRENQIQLEGPDGKIVDCGEEKIGDSDGAQVGYQEPVASAHFSEVWTDPLPGHDDGLALIGSRIRCFFPKSVLSDPYNATSRRLEGEVVDVVDYCEEQFTKRRNILRKKRKSVGILVDLLVDNKDGRQFQALPFLQRVDDVVDKERLLAMSDKERRSYKNEERIKGGQDKAIVRVLLSDEISSGMSVNRKSKKDKQLIAQPQAMWVIRKRVPAKIVRPNPKPLGSDKMTKEKRTDEDRPDSNGGVEESLASPTYSLNGKKNGQQTNGNESMELQPANKEASEEPPKKKRKGLNANKDFSSSRFLGDGNDALEQQEANWRWQAAKYNPFSILADRPLSKGLLERLCYNLVGEVIQIQPETSPESETLATVTIRCLLLPEHTLAGRLSHHSPYDVFENMDLTLESLGMLDSNPTTGIEKSRQPERRSQENKGQICLLRVPIEDLVIVRRKILRPKVSGRDSAAFSALGEMSVRYSYSFRNDTFYPLGESNDAKEEESENGMDGTKRCQRCRQQRFGPKSSAVTPHFLCQFCAESLRRVDSAIRDGEGRGSKAIICDCDRCVTKREKSLLSDVSEEVMGSVSKLGGTLQELGRYSAQEDSGFVSTRFVAKGMTPVDFAYNPFTLEKSFSSPSSKPISKVQTRTPKKTKKTAILVNVHASTPNDGGKMMVAPNVVSPKKDIFRPTSARTLTYDTKNRRFDASATELYQWKLAHFSSTSHEYPELPRNLRQEANPHADDQPDNVGGGKKLLGRAARANQRRLVRSIAAMGVNVDTLAGREQRLRFDRSGIHDWGVFVDIDLREGDMIVEYRGEVIGNAMAEKREKEYHDAKLGSDYMFRIDELSVCDATKQGNVARFINASCDPNCYTKIITLDGTKRIVIYAKRDIKAGEELSYDYKFAFEYDPTKRIPCHCGARDCRGFLNWDKRNPETSQVEALAEKVEDVAQMKRSEDN